MDTTTCSTLNKSRKYLALLLYVIIKHYYKQYFSPTFAHFLMRLVDAIYDVFPLSTDIM